MIEYILALIALLNLYTRFSLFIFRRRSRTPIKVNRSAAPFFWKRGKTVAFLIHGFTSSPHEFRGTARFLAKNNISVYAPLLPGHGTSPERLAVTKYTEWIEFLEEQLSMLEEEYDNIILIGNSFGGNLAVILADKSSKIKGLITLGTPMMFRHEKKAKYLFIPIMKRIKLFQKKPKNNNTSKSYTEGRYSAVPLRSLALMLKVVGMSKDLLHNVTVSTLVMQTNNDIVTNPISADYIIENISSKKKKKIIIPDSDHVFITDKYADQANAEILEFIRKIH